MSTSGTLFAAFAFAPRDLHTESTSHRLSARASALTELAYTEVIETATYQLHFLRAVSVYCNQIAYTVNRTGYSALVHVGKAQTS